MKLKLEGEEEKRRQGRVGHGERELGSNGTHGGGIGLGALSLRRGTTQLGGEGRAVHGEAMDATNWTESERWLQTWRADRGERLQGEEEEKKELAGVGH